VVVDGLRRTACMKMLVEGSCECQDGSCELTMLILE